MSVLLHPCYWLYVHESVSHPTCPSLFCTVLRNTNSFKITLCGADWVAHGSSVTNTWASGAKISNSICSCKRGQFLKGAACHMCPSGWTTDNAVTYTDSCAQTVCHAGQKFNELGFCSVCESGQYQDMSANVASCKKCPAGRHLRDPSGVDATLHDSFSDCANCSAFTYNPVEGHGGACFPCLSQLTPGAVSCDGCEPGRFVAQSGYCNVCEPGQYQEWENETSCEKCPAGRHLRDPSGVDATLHDSFSDCANCSAFTYNPVEGHGGACFPCLSQLTPGAVSCDGCDPGRFISASNNSCAVCPPGRYSNFASSPECYKCPRGYFGHSDDHIRIDCLACPRGKFGTVLEAADAVMACESCIAGRYSEIDGLALQDGEPKSMACTGCPPGRWSSGRGVAKESKCIYCGPGRYGSTTPGAPSNSSCRPCSPGMFSVIVGSGAGEIATCTKCPRGFAQTLEGEAFCLPCIPGRFSNLQGTAECKSCSNNTFAADTASKGCMPCSSGRTAGNGSASCSACSAGKHIRSLDGSCVACTAGLFSEYENSQMCTKCPSGYHQMFNASTACMPCIPGRTTNGQIAQLECAECAKDDFTDKPRSHACLSCKPGRLTVASGATICSACEPGQYQVGQAGSRRCLKCKAGRYQSQAGQTSCLDCGPGRFQHQKGQLVCLICAAGKFQEKTKAAPSSCKTCPGGYFRTETDKPHEATRCLSCDPGTSSAPGAVRCEPCEVGRAGGTPAQASPCLRCPSGLFADKKSQRACSTCQNGLVANDKGTSCESPPWPTALSCGDQFFLDDEVSADPSQRECRPCPPGGYCLGAVSLSDMPPLFGWYRIPPHMRSGEVYFMECMYHPACLGMPNNALGNRYYMELDTATVDTLSNISQINIATTSKLGRDVLDLARINFHRLNNTCNTQLGFKQNSPLCHSCAQGTRRQGLNRCAACPDTDTNYLLMASGAVLIVIVLVIVITTTIAAAGQQKISEGVTKIALTYLQIVALFEGFPLRWPREIEVLFEFQGSISTLGEHILNPDCAVGDSMRPAVLFYQKQLAYMLLPPMLISILWLFWRLYAILKCGKSNGRWSHRHHINQVTPKDKFVVSICSVLYLLYPTLCKQCFALFNCRTIGNGFYLAIDHLEPCYTGLHLYFALILGLCEVIIYVIGLPLTALFFLNRNRHRLSNRVVMTRYGLFYGMYRTRRYYWEVMIAMRKASVVLLRVFGSTLGIRVQAMCCLLLLLFFSVLEVAANPHKVITRRPTLLKWLELTQLLTCFCTMWAGLLMYDSKSVDTNVSMGLTWIVIAANSLLMLFFVRTLVVECVHEKRDTFLGRKVTRVASFLSLKTRQGRFSSIEPAKIDMQSVAPNPLYIADHGSGLSQQKQEAQKCPDLVSEENPILGEQAIEEKVFCDPTTGNLYKVDEKGNSRWLTGLSKSDCFIEPRSGRRYTVDVKTGKSVWVE